MSSFRLAAVAVSVILAGVLVTANSQNPPGQGPRPSASRPTSGPGFRGAALTPEQVEEVVSFAKAHLPERYEQLTRLKDENPVRYRAVLMGVHRLYMRVQRYPAEVRDAAIASYLSNLAIYTAQRDLRAAADPAEKAKLIARLKELLANQFDSDLIVKKYEVERLAKQLADLKAEVENRGQNRQKVIDDNLQKLLTDTRPASGRGEDRD